MIQIAYHRNFLKSAKKLPETQQQKLAKLLQLLHNNPFHPSLHTKRLTGDLAGLLSFRITRDWRVIFHFCDPQTYSTPSRKTPKRYISLLNTIRVQQI